MCRKAPSVQEEENPTHVGDPDSFGVNRPDFFRRVDVWLGRPHLSPHKRAKGESD